MKTLGNILWYFPFLGFINALVFFILGTLLSLTLIAAPIGLGLLQLSKFLLAPFSYSMIFDENTKSNENKWWKTYSLVVRIIYMPIGLFFATLMVFQIIGLAISLIGIPAAIAIAKSLPTVFNPVHKKCVPVMVSEELERNKAQKYIAKNMPA